MAFLWKGDGSDAKGAKVNLDAICLPIKGRGAWA